MFPSALSGMERGQLKMLLWGRRRIFCRKVREKNERNHFGNISVLFLELEAFKPSAYRTKRLFTPIRPFYWVIIQHKIKS